VRRVQRREVQLDRDLCARRQRVLNRLNGNAFTQYIGTIYTPSASWQIQGTDKAPLAGQVICYSATVTGNGSAGTDFSPNYAPAPPAARLIN
jgi:hypothetical protein